MLAWLPGESLRVSQLEERVDWELRGALAHQLVVARISPLLAHSALAAVLALLLWGEMPTPLLAGWTLTVLLAAMNRWQQLRGSAKRSAPAREVQRLVRIAVFIQALAWGLGVLVAAPYLPMTHLSLLMATFAGMIAAAPMNLIGDPRSFHLFTAGLSGPLMLAFLRVADSRLHVAALLLMMLYVGLMLVAYTHSHRTFVQSARTAKRLEFSQEEAARERGFLDALLTSAPLAIALVSRAGRVLGINPGFERTFGYSADDIVGRTLDDYVVPDSERAVAADLMTRVSAEERVVAEGRRRTADGRVLDMRIAAASVKGVQQGGVFVLYDDVSAIKKAERALRETEAQYRQLVESASDLVWRVDAGGRWTFVNGAVRAIYGLPAEELLGRELWERVQADALDANVKNFADVLQNGRELRDFETVHRNAGGGPVHLSFSASPVHDADGNIIGAHGMARDVTARVRMRDALERARDAAERAAEMRSAFLANMSHEIRTPLNGVLGMSELLLDSELNDEQRGLAEVVRGSGEALLELINDILDFSKMEAGRLELEGIPFELSGMVVTAARMLAIRAGERRVELITDIPPDVPERVRGDAGRLRQVLTNLTSNAVKFTENGEVVISIRLLETADGHARLRFGVRDTGIGIPADKLDGVFEEFQQADVSTTRKYGGTGLGLAISRRLVGLMGGELRVESEVGVGSEFWFELSLPVEEQERPDGPRVTALEGRRVLIVDDNGVTRRSFEHVFGRAGMQAMVAGGPGQALEILRREADRDPPVDLVVLDAQMPGKDGYTLAGEIRAESAYDACGLMICTTSGQRGDGKQCREVGVDAYLVKPVDRTELLEAAARVLARRDDPDHEGELITRHTIRESRRRVSVLLAEDNPVNQQVASLMLRKRGHHVTIVESGREAVDAVQAGGAFDVILMDIQMPELDGVSAMREIRALGGEHVPIIALTAHAANGDRERYLAKGMDGYLRKPFKPDDLFLAVERTDITAPDDEEPADEPAPETPVDVAGFRAEMRAAGVESAVDKMLAVFMSDAPGRMQTLKVVAEQDDPEAMRAAAHVFKSACRTIKAARLSARLQDAESAAERGDGSDVWALIPEIAHAYEEAMTYLKTLQEGAEVAG